MSLLTILTTYMAPGGILLILRGTGTIRPASSQAPILPLVLLFLSDLTCSYGPGSTGTATAFIQIIITTDTTTTMTTTTTTIIPAIMIGSMTLHIEKGLHTETEQQASASTLHSHPGQELARAETVQQVGSQGSHPHQELVRAETVQQAGSRESHPHQELARTEAVQQAGSQQSHQRQELARTAAAQQAGSQQSHPHQELVLQHAVTLTAVSNARTRAPGKAPECNGKAPSHPVVESKDKWEGLPLREIIRSRGSAMGALNAGQANAGALAGKAEAHARVAARSGKAEEQPVRAAAAESVAAVAEAAGAAGPGAAEDPADRETEQLL